MHLVLLSGGSGKRLWPLSNEVRAKQFLKLLPAPDGGLESMVQRVYRQICEVGRGRPWDSVVIAAGVAQADQLRSQLGKDVEIVLEPERRDTFPAIALACAYLHFEKHVGMDEVIAVLPVDPYVETDYFLRVSQIEDEIKASGADLLLLGAAPIFPSAKYGYIVPEGGQGAAAPASGAAAAARQGTLPPASGAAAARQGALPPSPAAAAARQGTPASGAISERVASFKEKPEPAAAAELIKRGALWNCGVFGLCVKYVFGILEEKYGLNIESYQGIKENFSRLRKTSFDYEVVEKARNIRVLRYGGFWKDLGSWKTFTEEIAAESWGNVLMDGSCERTHAINELDTPVVAMGAKGMVVVAGYDGILVADKDETHRLKDIIEGVGGRVMFEERRWGNYKVLDHSKYGSTEVLTKKLTLLSGRQFSYQYHEYRREIWNIISGEGVLYLDGAKSRVKKGDVVSVGVGEKHGLWADSDLELIEIQMGTPLIEEDIVRLEIDWAP